VRDRSTHATFPHGLAVATVAAPKLERWRRKLGDRLEDFRRALPEPLEWTRRFATAAQWARIDRHAIQRLCEGPSRCFGLLLASGIETGNRLLAPRGGRTGVSDQITAVQISSGLR